VLSFRGLCDELIACPEESYELCCVLVCDLETSRICTPYIYDISHLRVNEWWNNKFCYKVAFCWLFLVNHTTMHGSMNIECAR
jgi:hypothetical protein